MLNLVVCKIFGSSFLSPHQVFFCNCRNAIPASFADYANSNKLKSCLCAPQLSQEERCVFHLPFHSPHSDSKLNWWSSSGPQKNTRERWRGREAQPNFLFLNSASHKKRRKGCELITALISIEASKHLSKCVKRKGVCGKGLLQWLRVGGKQRIKAKVKLNAFSENYIYSTYVRVACHLFFRIHIK